MPSHAETTQHITSLLANLTPIDPSKQPSYNKVLEYIIDTRNAPPPPPIPMFGNVREGMTGINRLEHIYNRIKIIESKCLPDNGKFSKNQWAMINDFISTALPKVVTISEYIHNKQLYLDYLGVDVDGRFAGVLGSRQIGKTTCIAAVIAAIVVTCPDISIGLYASKVDQAGILQERVVEYIHRLGKKVDYSKTDHIATFHHAGRRTATVRAYSMNTEVRSSHTHSQSPIHHMALHPEHYGASGHPSVAALL